jgi:hypothetical protein
VALLTVKILPHLQFESPSYFCCEKSPSYYFFLFVNLYYIKLNSNFNENKNKISTCMKLSTFAKRGSRNRKIRNIFQKLFLFFFLEIDKRSFLNQKFFCLQLCRVHFLNWCQLKPRRFSGPHLWL